MAMLTLISLDCHGTEDLTPIPPFGYPSDMPYIRINGIEVWRGKLKSRTSADLRGLPPFPFDARCQVTLMEADRPDPDDHLGTLYVWARPAGEMQQSPLNVQGSWWGYSLHFQVTV